MIATFKQYRLQGDIAVFQPLPTYLSSGLIGGTAIAALLWLSLSHFSRIETVPGVVVEGQDAALVFPQHPGIVTQFLVRDGQAVQAGDRLAVVQTESDTASGERPMVNALESLAKQQHQSELQLGLAGQLEQSDRDRLGGGLKGARQKGVQIASEIALQLSVAESSKRMFELMAPVLQQGFISKVEYEQRREAYLGAEQQLAALRERQADNNAQIAQMQSDLGRAPLDRATAEAAHRTEIETLKQEQLRARQASSYLIAAPVDGRVTAIQVAAGRFVDGSKPLVTVIPKNSRFAVEVFATSSSIGLLRSGQEVRLMLDAFPYTKFGSFGGHVQTIARSIIKPEQLDAPIKVEDPVYRIRVTLDDQRLARALSSIKLQAGMTLSASIVLEHRTFLSWLLEPLASAKAKI